MWLTPCLRTGGVYCRAIQWRGALLPRGGRNRNGEECGTAFY
jgi:hypothetical protein